MDMFLVIVNPPFDHRSVTFVRVLRRQLRDDSPNASGGPSIHGRVPKAQEAAPWIPDETSHVILILHPDDETSCRSATQPQSGQATLLVIVSRIPKSSINGHWRTIKFDEESAGG